jgi:hypothetical protein
VNQICDMTAIAYPSELPVMVAATAHAAARAAVLVPHALTTFPGDFWLE